MLCNVPKHATDKERNKSLKEKMIPSKNTGLLYLIGRQASLHKERKSIEKKKMI